LYTPIVQKEGMPIGHDKTPIKSFFDPAALNSKDAIKKPGPLALDLAYMKTQSLEKKLL